MIENSSIFERFTELTGVRVQLCTALRDFSDLSSAEQLKIENGKKYGSLDKDTRTLRLYVGMNTSRRQLLEERMMAKALRYSISEYGLDGLFLENKKKYVKHVFDALVEVKNYFCLSDILQEAATEPSLLKGHIERNAMYAEQLAEALSNLFDFTLSSDIVNNVRDGFKESLQKRTLQRMNEGDEVLLARRLYDVLSQKVQEKKTGHVKGEISEWFGFGIRPYAMMRVGYPGHIFNVRTEDLYNAYKESGLSQEQFSKEMVRSVRNPLAVMESWWTDSKTRSFLYTVVLDLQGNEGKHLCLNIVNPEQYADTMTKIPNAKIQGKKFWASTRQLVINFNDNKFKFLRSYGKEEEHDWELLKELDKKIESEVSRVIGSPSHPRTLKLNANIRQNYRNTKLYKENYSAYDKMLQNQETFRRKIEQGDTLASQQASEKKVISSVEKMKMTFTVLSLSDKEKKLLSDNGYITYGNIVRNDGLKPLQQLFTIGTLDLFERILEEQGLTMYPRKRSVSAEEFAAMPIKKQQKREYDDFIVSMQYMPKDILADDRIPIPVGLDHMPFDGKLSLLTFVKAASMIRQWDGMPTFLSSEEMSILGLLPKEKADPVHVLSDGKPLSYYNLEDTNMKDVLPERYQKEVDYKENDCRIAEGYPMNMLSVLMQVRDSIKSPVKSPYSGYKDMKTAYDRAVEHYSKRLSEEIRKEYDFSTKIGGSNMEKFHEQKDSDAYKLATEAAIFLADNLNRVGIKTVVVGQEEAREAFENERDRIDLSVRDIQGQSVDIKDNRKIISPDAPALDASVLNEERRYENGELEGEVRAWEDKLMSLLYADVDERHAQGLYRSAEIYWNDKEALKNIRQIKGIVVIPDGFHVELPNCLIITGYISVGRNSEFSIPKVQKAGDIFVHENGYISAPNVLEAGDIKVHENGSLSAPNVQMTRNIFVYPNASVSLPMAQKTGDIIVRENGSLSAPKVHETEDIEVWKNGEMILPDGTSLKAGIYPASEIRKHLNINQQKEEFSYSDGTVYGYQVDDTIYLTPEGINPNTPIHEYTHIWAKAYQRLYPAEWDVLKEELKQHSMWGLVAASPEYEHIVANEDRLAGEVLAHIVGNSGEDLLVSAAEGAKTKEEVITNFRERISSFAMEEVFGLKSSANYEKLTMKVLNDFVSGRNPQDGIEFSVSNTGRRRERSGEAKTPRKENQNLYQTAAVEFSQMTSVPKSVKIYRPYKLDSYAMEGAKQICDELVRRVNIASSIDDLISIREEMESKGLLLNGHRFVIDREKGLFSYSESGEKRGQDFLVSYSAKENESHEHAEKAALQQLKNGLSLVVNTLAIDCDRELTKAKEDDRKRNKRIDFFLGMPTFLALIVGMLYLMGYGLLTATTGGVFPVLDFMVRRARNLNRHARRPFNVSKRRTPIEQFDRRRESLQRSLEKNISKNVTIIDRATDKPKEETASQEKAAEETKQKVEEEKKQKVEEKKEVEIDIERNADGSPRVRTADEGEETGRRPLSEITPTDEQVRIREERLREAEKDSEQEEVAGRSEGEDFVMSNLAACVTPESFKAEMERLEEAFNNGKTVYDKELNAILTKADFAMTRPAYIARSVQEIQTKYNSFIERIEAEYKTLKNYEGILGEESTFRSTFQDALGRIGPCSGEASQLEQMKKELADVCAAVDVLVNKTRLEVDGRERNEAEARLFFNGKTPTESDYREMANVAMKEAMERVASAPSVSCVAQRVNGEIIAGPSQILLQGHMLSNGYSLPVYLTAGDIAKYHLNVMGDGVLTYFNDRPDGAGIKGVRLYNIDETDFRFRNPEVYNRLVGEMAELREQVRGNNLMTSPKMNTYKTRVRNLASRVMQKMAAAMLTWSEEPSAVEYQGNEAQSCMAETVKSISTTDSYFNAATQVAEKLLSARAAKLSMSSDPKKGVDFASMEEKACESVQQEEKEKVRMEEQEVAVQAGEMAK